MCTFLNNYVDVDCNDRSRLSQRDYLLYFKVYRFKFDNMDVIE